MFPADARVGTDPPLALYVMEREAHAEVCKPESLRLLQDLLADDSPLRAPLLRLFQCALGGLPSHHLNRLQFRQWVRESEVERLDHGLQMQLELWFVLYTKPLNEMSFSAFVVLVDRVAATVYPELHERAGPREALQALLTERLAPYLRDALRPEADPWRAWHEEPSVDVVLYTLERPIGRIFERFKTASDLAALANPVPSDTRYFADGSHLRHVMDHTDFIKFAKAFGLCPDPLQIPQLMAIARAASLAHPRHVLKRGFHGVRLIEPEFRDAVVRCALAVHGAAGGDPGLCLKRLLDQFSDEYHRLFGVTLTADGEHNVPGPPAVHRVRPGVCVPQGGIDITLDGSNFCTRRGVFVRFGETVSRAHTIGAKRVVVTVPPLPDTVAQTLTARCEPLARGLTVAVTRSAAVDLCVSNNGRDFAPVRAEGGFRYELKLPDVRLPPDVQANLKRVHTLYCQWEDHSNTEFMSQAKWRVFEKDFRVEPTEPHDFFAQFAKVQGPKKEPTLSPVDFTSAVVQYLLWQHDDPQPLPHLQRLLGGGAVSLGGGAAAGAEECEELVAMRYEIEQTAGRLCRRFDVYRGPILVGTVEDRGGWVAYADAPRFAHEFLTYEEHDLLGSVTLRHHISACESFNHLLNRLISSDFHVAAAADPAARAVVHRAWRLKDGGRCIGAAWEYPGQICHLGWQPALGELSHARLTVTLYAHAYTRDFGQLAVLYKLAATAREFRDAADMLGYDLELMIGQ